MRWCCVCSGLSNNPHYFDRGTTAGLLLVHAICFREKQGACVVTMENLKDITEAKAIDNQVYVVENEMVFSYLTSSEKKPVRFSVPPDNFRR